MASTKGGCERVPGFRKNSCLRTFIRMQAIGSGEAMTLRCRRGDMAIVLQGSQVGKMVTVGEFQGDIEGFSLQANAMVIIKEW